MKDLKLSIKIDRPIKEVFAFAVDPKNTPKWVDFIVTEQTNEWPPKLGTIYRNRNTAGQWREFEVAAFEQDKRFELSTKDGFHVSYAFTAIDEGATELEYAEWMDEGELKDLLTIDILEKFKRAVEV
jgi:uncharacterized protein YndB with AHSA1/START domain